MLSLILLLLLAIAPVTAVHGDDPPADTPPAGDDAADDSSPVDPVPPVPTPPVGDTPASGAVPPGPPIEDTPPVSFTVAEPNDGELLGSVLTLQVSVFDPLGARVLVRFGGTVIGTANVTDDSTDDEVAASATIALDTSQLPNGNLPIEFQLVRADGTLIDSTSRNIPVDHPEVAVGGVAFDPANASDVDLTAVALTVIDPEAAIPDPGAPPGAALPQIPYVVIVSREAGVSYFPAYGMKLPFSPATSGVLESGVLNFSADGTTVLDLSLDAPLVTADDPVRLQVLIYRDGHWRAAPLLTLHP